MSMTHSSKPSAPKSSSSATKGLNFVNTSNLISVLECDEQRKIYLVEANIPIDRLVSFTLTYVIA